MTKGIKTNCPRDCYDSCGIIVEKRVHGKHRILGDPEHPVAKGKLCSKCALAYNGAWQDPRKRLLNPLKRKGPRGTGDFVPISWNQALSEISRKIQKTIADFGASSILHTHYSGTLSLISYAFPNRFFNHIGATEVDPDTICNAAGHIAWELLFGNSTYGFDPRTLQDANSMMIWGANPAHSAPHIHENWIGEFSGKVIVVDPVKTITSKGAHLHLQPNPGSDAALAFSILNCLHSSGKFDYEYIENCTTGYEEVREHILHASPLWGEKKSGVPADLIRKAADIYGDGPSLLWCGQGLQRQELGGNIMRSIGLLPALTGNIGKPGTGFYYLNISPTIAGLDFDWLKGSKLGPNQKAVISHMDLANDLTNPEKFKVFFCWNTNPLASAPEQSLLRRNLKREDLFTVVCDLFMTDTAKFADIILPAASFLEYDDITFSYFNYYIGAQSKISDPLGQSLPNAEIFRRLAREMNIDEASLYESERSLISTMLKQMELDINFSDLKRRGFIYLQKEPIIPYESQKFETASGKIEIASEKAELIGLPRTPLPITDTPLGHNHWRLLTPASFWRMNDSYSNDDSICKKTEHAKVYINTEDAKRLHLVNGDIAELYNEVGSLELEVVLDDTVLTKTLISYKGRWPSLERTQKNVNFLHKARSADMGNSSSVHSTVVQIRSNSITRNVDKLDQNPLKTRP